MLNGPNPPIIRYERAMLFNYQRSPLVQTPANIPAVLQTQQIPVNPPRMIRSCCMKCTRNRII